MKTEFYLVDGIAWRCITPWEHLGRIGRQANAIKHDQEPEDDFFMELTSPSLVASPRKRRSR